MKRRTWLLGFLALCFFLIMAAGFWLRSSLPQTNGERIIPGLQKPSQISRDHYGMVFIKAETLDDGYRALGYAHAQDRLWQMELMRRSGAGRLSEVFGSRTLAIDRFIRTLGFRKKAEQSMAALSPEVMSGLVAYAEGVNAYLADHKSSLPREFTFLGVDPEPWQSLDSLVWQKLMALSLSQNWRTEALRARFKDQLSISDIQLFLPLDNHDFSAKLSEITSDFGKWDELRKSFPSFLQNYGASNVWAVSGNKSTTGKPLLANDPHLGLELPILWYLARIDTPEVSLAGATVPGVPFHILGHNNYIAWGITSSGVDVEDLIIEHLDKNNSNHYMTESGSLPFQSHKEIIKVRNAPDDILVIRESRHGPIISNLINPIPAADKNEIVALQSTILTERDQTPEGLYRLNKAHDVASVNEALDLFTAPVQNVLSADVSGTIQLRTAGLIPLRSFSDQGPLPVDGSKTDRRWKTFILPKDLPRFSNPTNGVLSNANEPLSSAILSEYEAPYRAMRLTDRLTQAGPFQIRDMAKLQMDTLTQDAKILLPFMTAITPSTPESQTALDLLKQWDMHMSREKPEPLIYVAWLSLIQARLTRDDLGSLSHVYNGLRPELIHRILNSSPGHCDDKQTPGVETCEQQLISALEAALNILGQRYGRDLTTWRWGEAHKVRFINRLLDKIPFAEFIAGQEAATDGGDFTLNRGQTDSDLCCDSGALPEQWPHTHGAGFRAVYDLSDLNRSGFIIATGQSGNLFSAHYTDMVDSWRSGAMITLPDKLEGPRGRGLSILTLTPEARP